MAEDRQTKLDQTMSSVTPERLEATRQEVEVERQKLSSPKPPPLPPEEDPPLSDGAQRMKKLDLIQDVQLILVDKYRLGTKLMWGALGLMTLSLFGLTGLILKNFELHNRIAELQAEQTKLIERGAQIERKTDETKKSVDETKLQLDETQKKVDEAVEASPKIEIDAQGKAKVVLPVKKSDDKQQPKPKPTAKPGSSSAPAPSAAPIPVQIPVETKKF